MLKIYIRRLTIIKKLLGLLFVFISLNGNTQPTPENICHLSEYLLCGEDTVIVLEGHLNNYYQVFSYKYYFNNGNRLAARIFFINQSGALVGIYAIDASIRSIADDCVFFDVPKTEGGSLCLGEGGGLPEEAWVGGNHFTLFK